MQDDASMTGTSVEELRVANRAVVEAFFASNLANPEERLALWHPDGVKELPFAPAGLPKTRWVGREPYPQSFIHMIRVRDGRVILQREYFDSEILAGAERTARAKGRTPQQSTPTSGVRR
jgi:uncharacterized protein